MELKPSWRKILEQIKVETKLKTQPLHNQQNCCWMILKLTKATVLEDESSKNYYNKYLDVKVNVLKLLDSNFFSKNGPNFHMKWKDMHRFLDCKNVTFPLNLER